MAQHIMPIKMAFLTFLIISQIITIPLLIWRYHKDGAMTFWKAFMEYSFIFYLLSAFFLTLLPLPTKEFVAGLTGPTSQLVPFQFISDILNQSGLIIRDTSTYIRALKSPVALQVIFNVVMMIPFGIYLKHYFGKSFITVFLLSFLLSLFFEVTQLTGVYGIYSRPYRLFDVDDLFLNTLGGVIGYGITPFVMFLFPTREEIDRKVIVKSREIPFLRRLLAYGIDITIVGFLVDFVLVRITNNFYIKYSIMALILGLIYYLFKGQTIGLRLLKLRIRNDEDKNPTFIQSMSRSVLFIVFFNILPFFAQEGFLSANNNPNVTMVTLITWMAMLLMYYLLVVLHVLITGVFRKRPLVHERISSTHLVSTIEK